MAAKPLHPAFRVAELEAEVERLTRLVREVEACRMFDRFHAFDALQDDSCPCCGGPIRLVENQHGHLALEATRL
ncbi:MAG: hypothetical protein HY323_05465 [Betaproteobacteria bacterium]|nr:hypothetical protein [Betaproteobacteria bacterium]